MNLINLIGEGATADIYEYEGRAVKLFKGGDQALIFHEAAVTSLLEKTGLPVPQIYDVQKINGQWAIVMDLIEGEPLAHNMGNRLEDFVDLQIRIQDTTVQGFDYLVLPSSHFICRKLIESNHSFSGELRARLVRLLDTLPVGDKLCHNDYHGLNVLENERGLSVIDWTSATIGSPESDCCRTYVLMKLNQEQFAEPYLQTYCRRRKISSDAVLQWLPMVSAEWLYSGRASNDSIFLEWISQYCP